ncbi:transcriptional regulator [Lactiplantibacillus xiangfangensis]|uniref:Transcriptional regulator n=2 Tax=Lactiplantibacillus xiangfangensis TaxID=942150 RepID=A0A0R2MGZ6_9LACO|nr:transcriptional regulator [Lactiplantibacillus xiangfangensis]
MGVKMRKDAVENRAKILATAAKLFQQRSVSAVSMKDIASTAQIGTGTLYRNYPNKSELCLALSLDFIRQFITTSQQYLAQTTAKPVIQFQQVLAQYLAFRERRIQLLTAVETGPTVMATYYQSPLYQQLVELFKRILFPISGEISATELTFRADMVLAMLKSDSYAYQRQQQGLSQAQIAALISHLMIRSDQSISGN